MDSFTACKKIGNPKLGLLIQEGNYFEGREAETLKKWCELSRYVIDINQLFDVYRWNCGQLSLVPMNTDGRI